MTNRAGVVLALSALILLLAGISLQVMEVVYGGWPTLTPIMLMGYSVPFLAWAVWANRRARKHPAPWLARHASLIGVPLLVGGLLADRALTGVTSRSIEVMTWTVATADADRADDRVVLRFTDAPMHFIEITSEELVRYLETTGGRTVEAEFEVTRDYGRVRGYHVERVGPVARSRLDVTAAGCNDTCEGSPW